MKRGKRKKGKEWRGVEEKERTQIYFLHNSVNGSKVIPVTQAQILRGQQCFFSFLYLSHVGMCNCSAFIYNP